MHEEENDKPTKRNPRKLERLSSNHTPKLASLKNDGNISLFKKSNYEVSIPSVYRQTRLARCNAYSALAQNPN